MRGAYRGALVAEDGARELVEVAERVETAAFAELGAVEPHAIGGEVLDLDGIVGNCNSCVERGDARVLFATETRTLAFQHKQAAKRKIMIGSRARVRRSGEKNCPPGRA